MLLEFFDCAHDLVEVRPVAGVEFRVEKFAIGADLESAAARRNERERLDTFAEFKNFGRQTDGLRRVVSNHAIFDRHLVFHLELLSNRNRIFAKKDGQELEAVDNGAISLGRRGDLGMTSRFKRVQECNGGCPFANPPACGTPQNVKACGIRMGQPPFFLLGAPIKGASTNCYATVRRQS